MKRLYFLSILFLFGTITHLTAQTIYADRPTQGLSARTTSGFVLESGASLNDDINTIGQVYLRFGVAENLELQFNAGSLFFSDGEADVSTQAALLKYQLHNDGKTIISGAVRTIIPFINPDDGVEDFSTRISVLGDFIFSPKFMLNANLGYGEFFEDIDNGSINISVIPFFDISNSSALYAGYTGFWNIDDFDSSVDIIELGITYNLNPSFQIDAGIESRESTAFINVGIAKAF